MIGFAFYHHHYPQQPHHHHHYNRPHRNIYLLVATLDLPLINYFALIMIVIINLIIIIITILNIYVIIIIVIISSIISISWLRPWICLLSCTARRPLPRQAS